MFAKLRTQFSTAGLVLSVVAVVFALAGGAYAANNSATASKAKVGPRGKTGKTGPAGPQGLAGTPGTNGTNGTNGKEGPEGKQGPKGDPGQNGTVGFPETLPPSETETGYWSFGETGLPPGGHAGGSELIPISFLIPLETRLTEGNAYFVGEGGNGTTCPGSVEEPEAEPGSFCAYVVSNGAASNEYIFGAKTGEFEGTGTTGTLLEFAGVEEGRSGSGTWAVTAP